MFIVCTIHSQDLPDFSTAVDLIELGSMDVLYSLNTPDEYSFQLYIRDLQKAFPGVDSLTSEIFCQKDHASTYLKLSTIREPTKGILLSEHRA